MSATRTSGADRSSLNQGQREAATHFEGPALVLAGPGTGKTTTLMSRFGFLLEKEVDPAHILATTFTRPAARQLKQRISDTTGLMASELMVGTFHALCLRLLNGEVGQALGLSDRIKIASEAERFRILRDVGDRSIEPEDYLDAIDRYKDRLLDADAARLELVDMPATLRTNSLKYVDAYEAYQASLTRARLHDFGDLLMLVVSGLRANRDLRRTYSQMYQFLLVDEFQDVNPAQHEFIRLLLDQHDNLWAVGDDDQAIYGWRGSDVRYILDFSHEFPSAEVYKLEENYRSQPVIVERATRLIAHNERRLSKPLRAVASEAARRAVWTCGTSGDGAEAEWIALSIARLAKRGVAFDDIAILVRVRYLIPTITSALRGREIPFLIRGGSSIWNSTPAKALLGGLSLWSGDTSGNWTIPAYLQSEVTAAIESRRGASFEKVVGDLADLITRRMPFGGQPEKEMEWGGIVERIAAESRLFDDPRQFLAHALKQADDEISPESKEAGVCVSTIHQAKGLEWRAVFLAGCEVGIMPHSKSTDAEEERRLAYVAITRAKEYLLVTWTHSRVGNPSGPSEYVDQLHIPSQTGHPFQSKAATHSEAKRPPIPTGRRPLFRLFSESVAGFPRNEDHGAHRR